MNLNRYFLLATAALLPAAVQPVLASDVIEDTHAAYATVNLSDFNALEVTDGLNVVLVPSKGTPRLTVNGSRIRHATFTYTQSKEGVLTLKGDHKNSAYNDTTYLYAPIPADIVATQGADVTVNEVKTNGDLTLRALNMGTITTGDVACRSLTVEVGDVADVNLGKVKAKQDVALGTHGPNRSKWGDITAGGKFDLTMRGPSSIQIGQVSAKGDVTCDLAGRDSLKCGDISAGGHFTLTKQEKVNVTMGHIYAKDDTRIDLSNMGRIKTGDIDVKGSLGLSADFVGDVTMGDISVKHEFSIAQQGLNTATMGQVRCETFKYAKSRNTELVMNDLHADKTIDLSSIK